MNKVDLNQAPKGLIPFPVPGGGGFSHGDWCAKYCAMTDSGPGGCEMNSGRGSNDCVSSQRRDGHRVVYVDPLGKKNGKPQPPGFRLPT